MAPPHPLGRALGAWGWAVPAAVGTGRGGEHSAGAEPTRGWHRMDIQADTVCLPEPPRQPDCQGEAENCLSQVNKVSREEGIQYVATGYSPQH